MLAFELQIASCSSILAKPPIFCIPETANNLNKRHNIHQKWESLLMQKGLCALRCSCHGLLPNWTKVLNQNLMFSIVHSWIVAHDSAAGQLFSSVINARNCLHCEILTQTLLPAKLTGWILDEHTAKLLKNGILETSSNSIPVWKQS